MQSHHRQHLAFLQPAGPGVENRIAVSILNQMLDLGRSESVRAA